MADGTPPRTPIKVVDWSGEPLKPEWAKDRERVEAALQAAAQRLRPADTNSRHAQARAGLAAAG
jgi:hypothetical protein